MGHPLTNYIYILRIQDLVHHMRFHAIRSSLFTILAAAVTLSACSGGKTNIPRQKAAGEIGRKYESDPRSSLFGGDGISFGGSKEQPGANTGAGSGGIGVNSYLWRATLDTISFLPVSSADPFGGVILTDWFSPPETPSERFKLNVIILGRALRADGVKVSVFRQALDASGQWRDSAVEPDAGHQIEDSILTRARQLRNETKMLQN
jgi:hypothetical protein